MYKQVVDFIKSQFTEQDLATLCQSNVVVPPVVTQPAKNKFDWLGGEDLSIENF